MKGILRIGMLILSVASIAGCSKGSPGPGGGPGPGLNVWYPATRTITDNSGSAPYVETYEYDTAHNLIKFGNTDLTYREISGRIINQTTFIPGYATVRAYAFSFANATATTGDLYTGLPTEVLVTDFVKNLTSGVTSSRPISKWNFLFGGELMTKEITSDGGGQNNNYSYDDKKNLKLVDIVPLTGPRAPNVTNNIKVTGVDGNPSPFIAVKGYRFLSWPQGYAPDFALAYCNNNPTQIILERFDTNKNMMVTFEKNDFTYTYNENGYPSKIDVLTTYIADNGNTSSGSKTFVYTYKQ